MDALNISDNDPSRTRRRASKTEDDARRSGTSQQVGRTSRRPKPRSGRDMKDAGVEDHSSDKNRAPPANSTSFKKMFQRNKAPDP